MPNSIIKEETDWQKKKRDRRAYDPVGKKKSLTATGPEGPMLRNSLATHLLKSYLPKPPPNEDPREALLKHDAAAKEHPRFFGAYKDTQPVPIFEQEPEVNPQDENPLSAVPGYKKPKTDK